MMNTEIDQSVSRAWEVLQSVTDPEIPVLSVVDLGIVREVTITEEGTQVTITPTYSGCPAMNVIEASIRLTLEEQGFRNVSVVTVLSPAWTTDWMSDEGRKKLNEYGIAPPVPEPDASDPTVLFVIQPTVNCPHCGSGDTVLVSRFGSTSCKALYRCNTCREPFDYFKKH